MNQFRSLVPLLGLAGCLLPAAALAQLRCDVTPNAADPTQNFCQNPNFPVYGSGNTSGVITSPLPSNQAASPGHQLVMQPGSTNAFSLVMGSLTPGANLTTSASIRKAFYLNYITGNLYTSVGCPIDTGQACGQSPFNAVARHYPAGDPNDLHVMDPYAMELRATCTGPTRTNCTQGNVYGAMVRVPYEIRPGMTVKIRYRSPVGKFSWAPIWLFSGSEVSPGPETVSNPWMYPYQYPVQTGSWGANYEVDLNDNYGRWYNGTAIGYQIDYLTPDIYGVPWRVAPYTSYLGSTDGFTAFPNAGPSFVAAPYNLSSGFHDIVMSWSATTNMIYAFMDGTLIAKSYLDYSFAPWYLDAADGNWKQVAMHLIIGNQAIPRFSPGYTTAINNDGVAGGWTICVQEISAWYGLVTQAVN